MKIKSMRNLATVQTLRNKALARSRAELAAQLARLEHERVRLEREANIYAEKQALTQEALARVGVQIDEIQHLLYENERSSAGQTRGKNGSPSTSGLQEDGEKGNGADKKVNVVTLDY